MSGCIDIGKAKVKRATVNGRWADGLMLQWAYLVYGNSRIEIVIPISWKRGDIAVTESSKRHGLSVIYLSGCVEETAVCEEHFPASSRVTEKVVCRRYAAA